MFFDRWYKTIKTQSFKGQTTILALLPTDHEGLEAFEKHIYLTSVGTKSALGPNASAIKL